MRCPGQDMQYWKGDVAFEVACPKCATVVEFFKDESSRRCHECGHRFPNPKISFDCAQWCEYAEKCLGITPEMGSTMATPEAAFAGGLLSATEDLFTRVEAPQSPGFLVFQHARELVSKQPCNPRLVLAVALALELESHVSSASAADPAAEQPPGEELLDRIGLEDVETQDARGVLQRHRSDPEPADPETKIVSDAVALAQWTLDNSRGELEDVKSRLDELKTEAGKERAQTLFSA